MEQKILAIIKKVRNMYRFDKRYKAILETGPRITFGVNEKDELELGTICWHFYDAIYVSENEITFHPEYGSASTLIEYRNWDELLNL